MKAVVVLSGGLNSEFSVNIPTALRCDKVADIHQNYDAVICSSGTTYRKDGTTPPYSEAEGMKRYLMKKGVSAAKIIIEDRSKDTFSNAYYCRLLCLDRYRITEFDVVTSEYHLPRSQYLFDLVCPAPMYKVEYIAALNPVVSVEIIQNRLQHERIVLDFYRMHLSSTYNIVAGDMVTIGRFMIEINPAMTGFRDKHHEELTRQVNTLVNSNITMMLY